MCAGGWVGEWVGGWVGVLTLKTMYAGSSTSIQQLFDGLRGMLYEQADPGLLLNPDQGIPHTTDTQIHTHTYTHSHSYEYTTPHHDDTHKMMP